MHATYYRLKLTQFLPNDIDKCLYLDTDMLVLTDLREIFTYNLDGYVAGSSSGYPYPIGVSNNSDIPFNRREKVSNKIKLAFTTNFYFCAGLLLINLKEWVRQDIESKAMSYLDKYETEFADQDALNFAMKDNVLNIGSNWGILAYQYILAICDDGVESVIKYREVFNHIKIIHCNGPAKAWFRVFNMGGRFVDPFVPNLYPHKEVWCNMAKLCKAFEHDLSVQIKFLDSESLYEQIILSSIALKQNDMNKLNNLKQRVDYIGKPLKRISNYFKKFISKIIG